MSAEELDKEIEKLYETMKDQNKGEINESVNATTCFKYYYRMF